MIINKKHKNIKIEATFLVFAILLSCSADNCKTKIATKQKTFVVDWCTLGTVFLISDEDVVSLEQNEDCTYDIQCECGEEYRILYQNAFEEWVTEKFICSQSKVVLLDFLTTKAPYNGGLMTDRISLGDTLQIMGTLDHWVLRENTYKISVWLDENGPSIRYVYLNPDMNEQQPTYKLHTGQKAEAMLQRIREYEKEVRKIGTISQNTNLTSYYYLILEPDTLLVESNNYRWNGLTWLYEDLNR